MNILIVSFTNKEKLIIEFIHVTGHDMKIHFYLAISLFLNNLIKIAKLETFQNIINVTNMTVWKKNNVLTLT